MSDELGRQLLTLKRPRIGIFDIDRHYDAWSWGWPLLCLFAMAPAFFLMLMGVAAVGIWLAVCALVVLLVRSLPFYLIELHEDGVVIRRDIDRLTIHAKPGRRRLEIFARRERETWALSRFAQHFQEEHGLARPAHPASRRPR